MPRRPPLALVTPRSRAGQRPDPTTYLFTVADRDEFGERYWRVPLEAVESELFARIWNDGSERGCPTASSLLPPLALHAWLASDGDTWTPWTPLSFRRIAALAGVSKNSVRGGLDRLIEVGVLETRLGRGHPRDGALRRNEYRLHRAVFPSSPTSPYFRFIGSLIYGGSWCMLPRASARHLLMIIAALDPVYDGRQLRANIEADDDGRDVEETLVRRRRGCPSTATYLTRVSGMSASTVVEALRILCTPVYDRRTRALVHRVEADAGLVYHINDLALHWHWTPEVLNSPRDRALAILETWGDAVKVAA